MVYLTARSDLCTTTSSPTCKKASSRSVIVQPLSRLPRSEVNSYSTLVGVTSTTRPVVTNPFFALR